MSPAPDSLVVEPRVTVVVVNWNGQALLPACLDGLATQQLPGGFATWVVDNASSDGSRTLLAVRYPHVRVLRSSSNLGFAGGNNLALREVTTPYVALLNNDAVPSPGWLAALVGALDRDPGCAAVTAKVLLDPPGDVLNSAGGTVDRLGRGADRGYRCPDDGRWDAPAEVFYAPATACLLRTDAARGVGFFDDDYFLYGEDVDLCWRLRLAGWSLRYEPAAVARHRHSATAGATTGSRLHTFHDARNRLLTLVKCATAAEAARLCVLQVLTVLNLVRRSVQARDARRGDGLALARVLAAAYLSFLRLLPTMLRRRREIGRAALLSRREVTRLRDRLHDAASPASPASAASA